MDVLVDVLAQNGKGRVQPRLVQTFGSTSGVLLPLVPDPFSLPARYCEVLDTRKYLT